jgi:hypothetical protein
MFPVDGSVEGAGDGKKSLPRFCSRVVPEVYRNALECRFGEFGHPRRGKLELDITTCKASHNHAPISPLPYMNGAREWLEGRLTELLIPAGEFISAALIVGYTVTLQCKPPLHWLSAQYAIACIGMIRAHDREYTSSMKATKEWGLGQLV